MVKLLREAGALLVLCSLALSLTACGMQGKPPTRASLRVVAVPETARVYVDDRFVASARVLAAQPLVLGPGRHLVTLEASGYFPHDLELELPTGETRIEAELRPVPR